MAEETANRSISLKKSEEIDNDVSSEYEGRSKILVDLWEIICEQESPSSPACGGSINNIFPGLHINGFGEIGLPFREREAKEIIGLCGKRKSAKDAWELNSSEIQILNKDFVQQINNLIKDTVIVELGLGPTAKVEARLYKLLIHEHESIFESHKDANNEQGVFGSLVVTLPSHFEGGEISVSYQNTAKTFKPENPSYTTSYVASFADCEFTSTPMTSGYRLSLVYNLVSLSAGPVPRPLGNKRILQARECLQKWQKMNAGPSKFVYVLDRTPYSLNSAPVLADRDRGVVQLLKEAVVGEDFEMYLGPLNFTVRGTPDDMECDRYGNFIGEHVIDEVLEEEIEIRQLFNVDGVRVEINLPLKVNDVYPVAFFQENEPDSTSCEIRKFPTIEFRFKKVVVILLPKTKWADIMCEGKESDAVDYLSHLVLKSSAIESRDAPEWQTCKRMAKILLEKNQYPRVNSSFLDSLIAIKDEEMVQKYIGKVSTNFYGNEWEKFCDVIITGLSLFGWEKLSQSVVKFIKATHFDTRINMMARFTAVKTEDPKGVEVLKTLVTELIKEDVTKSISYVPTTEAVGNLARIANATDPALLIDVFALLYLRFMNVDTQFIPAAKILHKEIPSIVQHPQFVNLVQQCVAFLQNRIAIGQARADNWTILTPIPCNCVDCCQVSIFLIHPTQTVYRHKATSSQIDHIEESISKDLTTTFRILTLSAEGRNTLLIQKINKESDIAKQTAAKDTATIAELNGMFADDGSELEPALKRQKVEHNS